MKTQSLQKLFNKKTKLVVGLMSGTSLDGVDATLVKIQGSGINTKINLIKFITIPFPKGLKEKLIKNSTPHKGNVTDITMLNFLISYIYVDAIKKLCKQAKIPLSKIDLIGSHGQTIQHLPNKKNYFGYKFGSTMQIGDPAVIAKLTRITTVGDFRTGDMALGGEGAPLVPYFDFIMFNSADKNRALLNIGGISNITILKKKCKAKDIVAFDCGAGNMLIDFLMKKFFNKEYDKNGGIAFSGKLNEKLLNALIKADEFVERKIPKSTGREYYGKDFISPLLKIFNKTPKEDWITTITNFSAYSVYRNHEKFMMKKVKIDELFVSGGGARNKFLMKSLKNYFREKITVKNISELNVPSDAKEAVCFAVLANETITGNSSNIPSVTGARRSTILGKICLP
jgi:anhydro-N-acetylmuramic acid kinase